MTVELEIYPPKPVELVVAKPPSSPSVELHEVKSETLVIDSGSATSLIQPVVNPPAVTINEVVEVSLEVEPAPKPVVQAVTGPRITVGATGFQDAFEIFVNPVTGNDSGAGTFSSPFLTIQRALDHACDLPLERRAIVKLARGLYTEPFFWTRPNMELTGPKPETSDIECEVRFGGVSDGPCVLSLMDESTWATFVSDGGVGWTEDGTTFTNSSAKVAERGVGAKWVEALTLFPVAPGIGPRRYNVASKISNIFFNVTSPTMNGKSLALAVVPTTDVGDDEVEIHGLELENCKSIVDHATWLQNCNNPRLSQTEFGHLIAANCHFINYHSFRDARQINRVVTWVDDSDQANTTYPFIITKVFSHLEGGIRFLSKRGYHVKDGIDFISQNFPSDVHVDGDDIGNGDYEVGTSTDPLGRYSVTGDLTFRDTSRLIVSQLFAGNVFWESSETLNASRVFISGDLNISGAAAVLINGGTIMGDIIITNPLADVQVTDTIIRGDVDNSVGGGLVITGGEICGDYVGHPADIIRDWCDVMPQNLVLLEQGGIAVTNDGFPVTHGYGNWSVVP